MTLDACPHCGWHSPAHRSALLAETIERIERELAKRGVVPDWNREISQEAAAKLMGISKAAMQNRATLHIPPLGRKSGRVRVYDVRELAEHFVDTSKLIGSAE